MPIARKRRGAVSKVLQRLDHDVLQNDADPVGVDDLGAGRAVIEAKVIRGV